MIISIIFGTLALMVATVGGYAAGRLHQNTKWWFGCAEAVRVAMRHDIDVQAGMLHALRIATMSATGRTPPDLLPLHAHAIERSLLSNRLEVTS
jgi:hypothetical protein